MQTQTDIVPILERIAHTLEQPAIPLDKQWWDRKAVAAYLRVSIDTVDRLRFTNGFPPAARLPSDRGLGPLRWPAKEVMQWMERQR